MAGGMTAEECESLWTVEDVARHLKVSRSWVYQHASDGTLPCIHVGGLRRFDPAQIRRMFSASAPAAVVPLAITGTTFG